MFLTLNTSPNEEKSKTIAIFIKLFETKSTASNLRGLFLKLWIKCKLLLSDEIAFFKSVVVNEKKATSEPEIRAEHTNRIIISTTLKTIA